MAPRDDIPQGGAHRAREQQHDDARDPGGGFRGSADRPFHVRIIGADDSFYDAFRRPGGAGRERETRTGGTGGAEGVAAGFESMLTDARAIQAASLQAATNIKLAADAAQQFTRTMTAEAERTRRSAETERISVTEILSRMERMAERDREERRQDRDDQRPADGGGGGRRRRRGGDDGDDRPYPEPIPLDEDDGSGRPPDAPASPPARGPRSFQDRLQELHERRRAAHQAGHTSTGGLAGMARRAAGEALHERYGEGTSRTPTLVAQHDENGVLTHYNQHQTDGSVERIETDDHRVPGLVRTAERQAVISGASSALAAGGFGAAARAVPVVGTALAVAGAANDAAIWLTEQRAKNAQYQAIYGGSNMEGVGGRLQEEGFMWGQRLSTGMTEDDSRKLFKGVTSMGYSGSERSERLDFADKAYRDMGMSVEQSLSAVSLAAKGANTNFAGLQRGLKSVTLAARATGQSAETLRNSFLQTYAGLTQAGLGTGASSLSAGLTGATVGTNRQFDQIDTSGVGNMTALRVMGAQTGQTPGQLLVGEQRGGTMIAHQIDAMTGQAYEASVGPQAKQAAAAGIASRGGGESVQADQGAQHSIAQDVMNAPDWDSEMVANNLLALTNGQVNVVGKDPSVVAEQYVAYQAGNRVETQQKAAQAKQNPKALTDEDRDYGGIFGGKGQSKFVSDNYTSGLWDELSSSFVPGSSAGAKDNAVQAYSDRQDQTNQSDPVLEDLITNYGGNNDVGFEVETADGKRVVGLDEGIKYYSDQLAKGTATVIGGDDSGKSVQDAVGYAQKDFTPSSDGSADSTKGEAHGSTEADWKKDHATDQTDAAGQKGKITIEASDELRNLLHISGSGVVNPQVESAAQSGSTPYLPSGPN